MKRVTRDRMLALVVDSIAPDGTLVQWDRDGRGVTMARGWVIRVWVNAGPMLNIAFRDVNGWYPRVAMSGGTPAARDECASEIITLASRPTVRGYATLVNLASLVRSDTFSRAWQHWNSATRTEP